MESISEYLDPTDGSLKGRAKGLLVGMTVAVIMPFVLGIMIVMLAAIAVFLTIVPPIAGLVAPRRFAAFFHRANSKKVSK